MNARDLIMGFVWGAEGTTGSDAGVDYEYLMGSMRDEGLTQAEFHVALLQLLEEGSLIIHRWIVSRPRPRLALRRQDSP